MRDELDLFLVEGEKMALELIKLKVDSIDSLYATSDFIKQIHTDSNFHFEEITEKELAQISTLKTPNKVLVVCKKWDLISDSKADFFIALDEIQDPGNLGTIIRLADWFGVKNIVCSKNTADCFNPKVVQATMGSLFRVNIVYEDLKDFIEAKKLAVYGAFLEGESIYKSPLLPKGILVLGNEGNGISSEIEKCITQKITIPRFGEAESLNVSVATGILLSEFFRGG